MAALTAPLHPTYARWGKKNSTTYVRLHSALRDPDLSLPAVVVLHGMDVSNPPPATLGEAQLGGILAGQPVSMVSNVVQAGYDVYAPFQGRNWCAPTSTYSGNILGTGTTGITDCMLQAQADGHPANSVLLLATSGGGGSAFAWSAAHPTWLVAFFGQVPLCDLVDAHSRTLFLPLAPSIEAQYGAGTWLANSAPYDPARNAASYTAALCAKMRCVWGGADTCVHYTATHAFATAHPLITASWVNPNPSGHFVFLDNGWDEYEATRWFDNATGRTP